MARKKHEAHANHERWLVSYADFITLLFAFFVVMFATSQTDKAKAERVSESVKEALEGDSVKSLVAVLLGGAVDKTGQGNAQMHGPGGAKQSISNSKPQVVELLPSLNLLTAELKKEIETGKLRVSMGERGLVVSFTQAALFPSGEDEISPDTYETVQKIANAMKQIPNPARLEGHTDAIPIHNSRFRSNWELSAARSIALLELLTADGVPRDRMSIAGYAETAPVDNNETEQGRAKNRRVDIVILNATGLKAEPDRKAEPGQGGEKSPPKKE